MQATDQPTVTTPAASNQPVDAAERAQALDISRSFAVSAPAGSGKTGLLTQRLLKLLSVCEQPEEVLAITFTRKAAGEMRERLLDALLEARDTQEPENPHAKATWQLARQLLARDAELNWNLLQSPQRLRIQTIDGLCRNIASQLPIDSGLGAPGEPLEQPGIAYEMAIINLLKRLEQAEPDSELNTLLLHLDNNLPEVTNLLQTLLEKREQWLEPLMSVHAEQAEDYFHFVIDELVGEALSDFQAALGSFAGELVMLADYAGSNLQKDKPEHNIAQCARLAGIPDCTSDALPQWLALADLLTTTTGTFRKSRGITKAIGFPAADKKSPDHEKAKAFKDRMIELLGEIGENQPLLEAIAEVRKLPAGMVDSQWQILRALSKVLPLLVAELKLVFQQLGATDFTEVAQAALVALGNPSEPTDLALKLDIQIRHILVDEFQDTSQLQLELLQRLTAGWETNDGRSLFIVGDGMQSCYGFRNANVGIFLDARAHGIGDLTLTPLNLQVNFRSSNAVVDWVNRTFTEAFPPKDNISRGAVRYLPSTAFKPQTWPDAPVSFYGCIDDEHRTREAEQVAQLVQDLQQRSPDSSIAILVRNKKHLEQILPALTRAGIPFQAQDLAPLASRMVVLDLLSLTRALADPSDRLSWLAILRAPWCGLSLPDLYAVSQWGLADGNPRDPKMPPLLNAMSEESIGAIPGLSNDGRNRLSNTATLIRTAWQNRGRKPLRVWLEGLWMALGGPATAADKRDLSNVEDFFQLLEKYDQGGQIGDWKQFEQALDKLFARPSQEARVQIMTIHKSKGLEFDHVLIPGLDRTGGAGGSDQLLRWCSWLNREADNRFLLAPKSPRSGKDPLYEYIKYDNSERERLEGTRLLYVGCTRAIHSLHLLGCVKPSDKEDEGFKSPGAASLLASIWHALDPFEPWCHWLEPEDDAPQESSAQGEDDLLRLPQQWAKPEFPQEQYLARFRMKDYEPAESDEPNLPELGQVHLRWFRHAGTVAHETLATLSENADWTERDAGALAAELQPLWQLRLGQLGLSGNRLSDACDKVEQAVLRTVNCPQGRWILDHRHRDAASELELHSGGRQLRRFIVDRTFIDTDGTRWIIDYKTAEPAEGEDPQAFVEAQLERYRNQLDGYRKLFYQRGEHAVRCALYFPLMRRLAELPAL